MSGCVSWANNHKEPFMDKIHRSLNYVERIEHTGSSYENLKIKQNSLEWDVIFLFNYGDKVKVTELKDPGYVTLTPKEGQGHLFQYQTQNEAGFISSVTTREKFHWDIQMALNYFNEAGQLNREVGLSHDGQATRMVVLTTKGWVWYTLDLIPAYEVDGKIYVSKPMPGTAGNQMAAAWCRSTALEEKQRIVRMDEADNGCRCMVTRNLKLICSKDEFLRPLSSYLVKTTLLHLTDRRKLNWAEDYWLARLRDMMHFLAESLEVGHLPHYFIPNLNLLSSLDPMFRQTRATRLMQLVDEEDQLRLMLPEDEQIRVAKLNEAKSEPINRGHKRAKASEPTHTRSPDIAPREDAEEDEAESPCRDSASKRSDAGERDGARDHERANAGEGDKDDPTRPDDGFKRANAGEQTSPRSPESAPRKDSEVQKTGRSSVIRGDAVIMEKFVQSDFLAEEVMPEMQRQSFKERYE